MTPEGRDAKTALQRRLDTLLDKDRRDDRDNREIRAIHAALSHLPQHIPAPSPVAPNGPLLLSCWSRCDRRNGGA